MLNRFIWRKRSTVFKKGHNKLLSGMKRGDDPAVSNIVCPLLLKPMLKPLLDLKRIYASSLCSGLRDHLRSDLIIRFQPASLVFYGPHMLWQLRTVAKPSKVPGSPGNTRCDFRFPLWCRCELLSVTQRGKRGTLHRVFTLVQATTLTTIHLPP